MNEHGMKQKTQTEKKVSKWIQGAKVITKSHLYVFTVDSPSKYDHSYSLSDLSKQQRPHQGYH